MPRTGTVSFALLALCALAGASAVSTVPLTKRVDAARLRNLPSSDRARLHGLLSTLGGDEDARRAAPPIAATNRATSYTVDVQIGSPPTTYSLIVDTGSANTWVGANKKYEPTASSEPTNKSVSVSYGTGFFAGKEVLDRFALSEHLVVDKQSLGVAEETDGFDGFDGILGLGPAKLSEFTVDDTDQVPTVTDNLQAGGALAHRVLGVSFLPNTVAHGAGSLTFGGTDSALHVGPIAYVPITSVEPSNKFFGVNASVALGSDTLLPHGAAGIVDTGTTLVLLATEAYDAYVNATGAVLDGDLGLLRLTKAQYKRLRPLTFHIGHTAFVLTPNAQILSRSLNVEIGGQKDAIYLVIHDLGGPAGIGLDFIIGQSFLQRFYSVFDSDKSRVGFAYTKQTFSNVN
ncbi:family A1 protease [Auricularia subglabra TFB-10046 SS5]|uniref:Family A1 protease n=1 Tax=Auricularia subglabra (strain TFB-10046 / SS5) TaxID=717982 RepID=J0LK54_AURST|nr:family A1 protease [Auricularia subglabra TFB-10046 SS5]